MTVNQVLGQWVPNEDLAPETNIAGRAWMTKDGEMSGVFRGYGQIPLDAYERGILWHFPDRKDDA